MCAFKNNLCYYYLGQASIEQSLWNLYGQPTRRKPVSFNYRIQIIYYIQIQRVILLRYYTRDGVVVFDTFLDVSFPFSNQSNKVTIFGRSNAKPQHIRMTQNYKYSLYISTYLRRARRGNPLGRSQYTGSGTEEFQLTFSRTRVRDNIIII